MSNKLAATVFVSMPFGENPDSPENEWTKLFEYGLKPLEREMAGLPEGVEHKPIKLWRADRSLESLNLKANVISGLEKCDLILAVLTTSIIDGSHGLRLTNPNVLWELGYADAIGKPIVALADSNDLRRLPVLAGIPNVCVYNHKLVQDIRIKDGPNALSGIARDLVQYISKARDESVRGPAAVAGSRTQYYTSRDIIGLPGMICSIF